MTTNAATLAPGISYPQAIELATQIDGTGNADRLARSGFSGPVAIELVRQMGVGTGNVNAMMASGINPGLATAIKTAIDA